MGNGLGNGPFLPALVTASQQENDCLPLSAEVDTVAGTMVDPELLYPSAQGLAIAQIACRQAGEPGTDSSPGQTIGQSRQPSLKRRAASAVGIDTQFHDGIPKDTVMQSRL